MITKLKNGIEYRIKGLKGRINRYTNPEPKVLNSLETLDIILKERKSMCRLGDGEFNLIFGKKLGFQNTDTELGNALKNIVSDNKTKCLIGIPDVFGSLKMYRKKSADFWYSYLGTNRKKMIELLDLNIQYVNTNVTRFQTGYWDKSETEKIIAKYKEIWDNREIVFIEGEKTRLGVGNDLFDNAESIERILGPATDAFARRMEILDYCEKYVDKNKLIILALGPTATVLAYELCSKGFWALDLGHIDIQYEYYLRGITGKQAIPGKWVNESNEQNVDDFTDESYMKSIIKKFV